MKRVIAVSVVTAAVLAGAASAQDAPAREDGVYARLGAGVTFASDWEQDFVRNPGPGSGGCLALGCNPDRQILDLGKGFVAGAALGFDYADGIRTELEYRYASAEISDIRLFESAIEVSGLAPNDNINSHFLMTNFYFDFYNNGPLTPFIGGGVGGAFVENEFGERDAALAWQARGGVALALGDKLSADLEYVFLRSNKLVYGPNPEDFTPQGPFGTATVGERYQSSSVMISLRKHF